MKPKNERKLMHRVVASQNTRYDERDDDDDDDTDSADLPVYNSKRENASAAKSSKGIIFLLIIAHFCFALLTTLLLLSRFVAFGVLLGAVFVGMLAAELLVITYQRRMLASREHPHLISRSPLRTIALLSLVSIVFGTSLGVVIHPPSTVTVQVAATATAIRNGVLVQSHPQGLGTAGAGGLAFATDGASFAVGTPAGVEIWNEATHKLLTTYSLPSESGSDQSVISLAWNAQSLAASYRTHNSTGKSSYGLIAWHIDSGKSAYILPTPGPMRSLAWSPDGTTLAGYLPPQNTNGFGVILLWDAATGASRAPIFTDTSPLAASSEPSFTWSPDPGHIAVINHSKTILILDIAYGNSIERYDDAVAITTVVWSPNGQSMALGHIDGQITVLDVRSLTIRTTVATQKQPILHLVWSPDSRDVMATDADVLTLFDSNTGKILSLLNHPEQTKTGTPIDIGATNTPTSSAAVTATSTGGSTSVAHQPTIIAVAWSSKRPTIAALYSDGDLIVWDTAKLHLPA